jgi:hypothetical protein
MVDARHVLKKRIGMTTMVRLLERDGLVERRPDPHDGRAALVFPTRRAQAFRPVAEASLHELADLAQQRLGTATAGAVSAALRQLADLGLVSRGQAARGRPLRALPAGQQTKLITLRDNRHYLIGAPRALAFRGSAQRPRPDLVGSWSGGGGIGLYFCCGTAADRRVAG